MGCTAAKSGSSQYSRMGSSNLDVKLQEALNIVPEQRRTDIISLLQSKQITELALLTPELVNTLDILPCDRGILNEAHQNFIENERIYINFQEQKAEYIEDKTIPKVYVLVVGISGHGKSTFINCFTNYLCGATKIRDKTRYISIIPEQNIGNSQTKQINEYKVRFQGSVQREHIDIIFIDTPGLNDTQGFEKDTDNINKIGDYLCHKISQLNFVVFVLCESRMEMTPSEQLSMGCLLKLFGNNCISNSLEVLTFSDLTRPRLEALQNPKSVYHKLITRQQEPKCLQFQNSSISAHGDLTIIQEYQYKRCTTNYQALFNIIKASKDKPINLRETQEVIRNRKLIYEIQKNLEVKLTYFIEVIKQIKQNQWKLDQVQKGLMDTKDFEYIDLVQRVIEEKMPDNVYVTNCKICNTTCHANCEFSEDKDKIQCIAFDGKGKCMQCEGRCKWDNHINQPYKYVTTIIEVKSTYEEMKAKYQANLRDNNFFECALNECTTQHEQTQQYCLKQLDQLFTCKQHLYRSALFNPENMLSCMPELNNYLQIYSHSEVMKTQIELLEKLWRPRELQRQREIVNASLS